MSAIKVFTLTVLAMVAFAGNSILCRMALKSTPIDAASFTSIRLISGAVVLWLIAYFFRRDREGNGNWISAFALFAYAVGFSFAYINLTTATGALLLFGAVQLTMIGYGLWKGERLSIQQQIGLVLAVAGVVGLMLPGLSTPPLVASLFMIGSGVAWGIYSLRGKGSGDSTRVTAGNFIRAAVLSLLLSIVLHSKSNADVSGIVYAVLSGALASGIGYALWYAVLPWLKSSTAATVQLTVPVIAAFAGVVLLSETLTMRLVWASFAVLGGIALIIVTKKTSNIKLKV